MYISRFVKIFSDYATLHRQASCDTLQAAAIHGDVSQSQRSQAMDDFKAGTQPLLIATDVAARGLDVPDVSVVINFSFPLTTEDYVHRIGRTGRAGKSGAQLVLTLRR